MDESERITHTAIIGACLCFIVFVCALSHHYTSVTKAAIAAGLVEGTLPGSTGTHWVKP